jgi:hypothetical protein
VPEQDALFPVLVCIRRQGKLLLTLLGKPAVENVNPSHLLQGFISPAHLCRGESQSRTYLLDIVDRRSGFIVHLAFRDPLCLRVHEVKCHCPHCKTDLGVERIPVMVCRRRRNSRHAESSWSGGTCASSSGVKWREWQELFACSDG